VTKSKTVETIKDLRRQYPHAPKRDRLEFSRLSKNRSRVGGKSVLIFADALHDEGAGGGAEDREVR
jgi:hypothetical protein